MVAVSSGVPAGLESPDRIAFPWARPVDQVVPDENAATASVAQAVIILYCLLNILLTLSGLIEKLLKLTVILAIPSKILGALLGLIEGILVSFLLCFVFLHLAPTEKYVMDSKLAIVLLERCPFIGRMTTSTTLALEDINNIVNNLKEDDNRSDANFKVLHQLIYWKVITVDEAQALIDNKKIVFDNEIQLGE